MHSMQFIDLGGTPSEEDCAQTGKTQHATELNKLECRAYMKALEKKYGPPPEGCRFSTHSNPHDFGTYYTVRLHYDNMQPPALRYADAVEKELSRWLDVDFWAPVSYHDGQAFHVIADLKMLDRAAHPRPPYSQHEQLGIKLVETF